MVSQLLKANNIPETKAAPDIATDSSDHPAWFFGTATPQLPPWRNHLHVPPGTVGNSDNRKATEFSCEHRHISDWGADPATPKPRNPGKSTARFQQSDYDAEKLTQRQTFRSTHTPGPDKVASAAGMLASAWYSVRRSCGRNGSEWIRMDQNGWFGTLRNSSKPPKLRLKTAKAGVWPYGWVLVAGIAEAENPISPTNIKPGGTNPQNVILPFINGIPQLVNWCKLGVCLSWIDITPKVDVEKCWESYEIFNLLGHQLVETTNKFEENDPETSLCEPLTVNQIHILT